MACFSLVTRLAVVGFLIPGAGLAVRGQAAEQKAGEKDFLVVGSKVAGALDQVQAITYKIKLAADRTYVIHMVSPNPRALDPLLRLLDAEGKQLAEDDDSGGDLNARIIFHARAAGTYQIVATCFDKGSGPFSLLVREGPDEAAAQAKLLPAGHWKLVDLRLTLAHAKRFARMDAQQLALLAESDELMNQAIANDKPGRHQQGAELAEKALALRARLLGEDNSFAADSAHWAGFLWQGANQQKKARQFYEQALAIRKKVLGDHPETARTLHNLAWVLSALDDGTSARRCYEQALAMRKKVLESDHLDTAWTLHELGTLLRGQQDYAGARPHLDQALAIRKKVLGDHADTAQTLHNLGLVLAAQGDAAGARGGYERALAIRKKLLGDHVDTAWTLHNLGYLLWEQKDYARALPLLEQAVAMRRKVLGEKHTDVADSLEIQALLHQAQENYPKAEPLYKQVVEIRRHVLGEKHPDYGLSLNNLASLYNIQKDYAKAEPLYRQALEVCRQVKGEKDPVYAAGLSDLADLCQIQGEYAKAELLYRQALEIRREVLGEKHPDFTSSTNNLAALYINQGEYARAEPLLKQALEICRQVLGAKHPDLASILNNLAALHVIQGDYAKAEPLFKQALELRREVLGEKHADFAASLLSLAILYQTQGDYAKAEPLHKQALEIHRQVLGAKHPHFAASLNILAFHYQAQGDYAKAVPLHQQALEIDRHVLGEKHPQVAVSLHILAEAYQAQKEFAKAEPLHQQALEIRRAALGEKHPDFALSLTSLALLYQTQGGYAKAQPLFKQALEIYRRVLGEKHPRFADSLNNLAGLYQARGDYALAEPLSRQSLRITREHLEHTSLIQSERQQFLLRDSVESNLRTFLGITAKLPATVPTTYDVMLSWKGSVTARQRLSRLARTSLAGDPQAKQLFDELETLSRQVKLWSLKSPKDLPPGIDLPKKLADLSERRELIEAKLSARTEAFRKLRESQRLTSADLQKLLPAGTVLVDFVVYGEELAAFVVAKDQLHRVELGKLKPLAEAVVGFRATLKRTSPLQGKNDPARVLREQLLAPLDKYWTGAKRVLIAPDGPLNQLPFAALPGRKEGTYLLEEVALAIIPVPQMLPELLAKRDPARENTPPSLLALGDVDFEANPLAVKESKTEEGWKRRRAGTPQNWKRLPGTLGEVLSIEDTFRKAVPRGQLTVLRGGQATEAAVRRLAAQHEYLHFATHGFFAAKEVKSAQQARTGEQNDLLPRAMGWHPGLLSGIVLAGANKPRDDDDGVLTALEVGEMDLSRVELAVLSACETGLGEVAGGEGVLGLQRAFQTAGARSVVTSLWKVDDEATRKLMERFYENYWKKEMGTLEALREAQLWLLREGATRGVVREDETDKTRRTPPHYWAAFVLSGDWR